MKFMIIPFIAVLLTESVAFTLSIIAQQRYIKLYDKERRLHDTPTSLTVFSFISLILSIILQTYWIYCYISDENISFILTIVTILYGIVTPYFYFFISKYIDIPHKNFPMISKFITKKFSEHLNFYIPLQYKYENTDDNTLLLNFLDVVTDMVWVKDINNKFTFVNSAVAENLLKLPKSDALRKTSIEIAEIARFNGIRYTFGELCSDSDEVTKEKQKPSAFFEYGYVGDKLLALHVLKAPIWHKKEIVGTIGIGRDVTQLFEQHNEIECLFRDNNIAEGVSRFFSHSQQFKSLQNTSVKNMI